MSDKYPEDPAPNEISVTPVWKTLISDSIEDGEEQRRQRQLFPTYDVNITYLEMNITRMKTLWEFYMDHHGALDVFYAYDLFTSMDHTSQFVGLGDGSTDTFDLPGRTTSSRTVYVNGVEETSLSYLTGGGSASSDRVEFASAVAEGAVITCDFTGYLRIKCRFLYDRLARETFYRQVYQYGVDLKGLKGA